MENTYPPKHKSSFFVSLEGIEGSGKSTQIQALKDFFEAQGLRTINVREPGGTKLGEKIRETILSQEEKISEISELFLFAASRAHLLNTIILPELAKPNTVIIADRYIDSSIAYQGIARGLGVETVIKLHEFAPLNFLPDLTFYLEIDLATSFARQASRGNTQDYFEKENTEFYQKLISGYEKARELFPQRITTIDASQTPEAITKEIHRIAAQKLGLKF